MSTEQEKDLSKTFKRAAENVEKWPEWKKKASGAYIYSKSKKKNTE